ncbi:nuclear transport factor 2 family protein [Lentzea sp. NBRC 102530]|uniref:YybH family protein n=1 Tax=Lentzea sp. NBRC 102530 TaxID=3032201 RepID=UPI0025543039|nr:nuclear transport factor 2 family protein [Lentzea sp. NBRC 102530]
MHPSSVAHAFAAAFNSRDPDAVDAVYEPGGLFVPAPGLTVTGTARRDANQRFLAAGLPIDIRPRHVYEHDGIALLIVDWSIGEIEGTATDVARRGADGRWRYVIDNPFGTSRAAPEPRS